MVWEDDCLLWLLHRIYAPLVGVHFFQTLTTQSRLCLVGSSFLPWYVSFGCLPQILHILSCDSFTVCYGNRGPQEWMFEVMIQWFPDSAKGLFLPYSKRLRKTRGSDYFNTVFSLSIISNDVLDFFYSRISCWPSSQDIQDVQFCSFYTTSIHFTYIDTGW